MNPNGCLLDTYISGKNLSQSSAWHSGLERIEKERLALLSSLNEKLSLEPINSCQVNQIDHIWLYFVPAFS